MKFSIIIPVYKVESYLRKCVDSILCQNFSDYEVILVDDGSPDLSPKICDEYSLRYSNVVTIHKENGGLSSARNVGITTAKGDYLIFLDSDDYWDSELALSKINETLVMDPDVLIFGCKDFDCSSGITSLSRSGYNCNVINSSDYLTGLNSLFNTNLFPGSAWITVTNKSFVIENNIFFKDGIKAEDIDWLVNVFYNARSLKVLDETFYVYLKNRDGSITNTADLKSAQDILYSISKWFPVLDPTNKKDKLLLSFLSYHFSISLMIFGKFEKCLGNSIIDEISSKIGILQYGRNIRVYCIFLLSKILSIRILIKFIYFSYNLISR